MLILLAKHPSVCVISDMIRAFYQGQLDRKSVEPILRKSYRIAENEECAKIQDAIDDIQVTLKWQIIL